MNDKQFTQLLEEVQVMKRIAFLCLVGIAVGVAAELMFVFHG